MAVADTANLIVSLKLDDRFSGPLRGINQQLDTFTRNASVRGGLGQIGRGLGVGVRNAALLAAPAVAGLALQIREGVDSLRELENVNAQTVAGLESTGAVSGQTLESIRRLSEEYETLGGVLDDKVIQAGANVLLTFRHIDKQAFEPALEQALNLSTALGTDLQTAILQVGKALDDPVRGVTALRRAGVQLTDEQQRQIKTLMEQNDLYGAQQIILAELEKQVGGRFAAAGRTNEATVARMGDAWEDLQMALSRAFLPAIDRVARRLTTIFSDQQVIAGVEDFGERLAGFLNEENLNKAEDAVRGLFDYLGSIPWGAIGDGLRIAGSAAKVAVDAFRSLPPDVQNALITLLAANKLTGGLVASGLGQLVGVALSSLKTITAGHVTVVGTSVTGGGVVPTPDGKRGGGLKTAGTVALSVLGLPLLAKELGDAINEASGVSDEQLQEAIDNSWWGVATAANTAATTEEAKTLRAEQAASAAVASSAAAAWNSEQRTAYANLYSSSERQNSKADALASLAKSANDFGSRTAAATEATSRKNFSPLVKVDNNISIPVSVSARVIAERVYEQTLTTNGRLDDISVF